MAELNPEEQRQLCSGFFYFWSDYGRIRDAVGKKGSACGMHWPHSQDEPISVLP